MKFAIFAIIAATSLGVAAENVSVQNRALGSGTPGVANAEPALIVNDYRHAPQYMPEFPTAATIWPRVVEVPCTKAANGDLACEGYNWSPAMGRGEYLLVQPKVVEAPKPVVREVVREVPVIKEVIKEVPAKKIKE